MTVIGAEAVDAAAAAGVLVVAARDVVTPLARDRARERGVELVVATPGTAAAVTGDRAAPGGRPGSGRPVAPGARPERGRPAAGPPPGSPPSPPSPPPDPVRPPSGALYRRGAPLPPRRPAPP